MRRWTLNKFLQTHPGLVCITGWVKRTSWVPYEPGGKYSIDGRTVYYLPETGLHPVEQARYIKELRRHDKTGIVITMSAFMVTDFDREDVLIAKRRGGYERAEFQTLGASVNKITMCLFDQAQTIGAYARSILERARRMPLTTLAEVDTAIKAVDVLGDSVEKTIIINHMMDVEDKLKKQDT